MTDELDGSAHSSLEGQDQHLFISHDILGALLHFKNDLESHKITTETNLGVLHSSKQGCCQQLRQSMSQHSGTWFQG